MYEISRIHRFSSIQCLWVVHAPGIARDAIPGQFVTVRVDGRDDPVPIGIADFDAEQGTINLIIHLHGDDAEPRLLEFQEGDLCDIQGPVGIEQIRALRSPVSLTCDMDSPFGSCCSTSNVL